MAQRPGTSGTEATIHPRRPARKRSPGEVDRSFCTRYRGAHIDRISGFSTGSERYGAAPRVPRFPERSSARARDVGLAAHDNPNVESSRGTGITAEMLLSFERPHFYTSMVEWSRRGLASGWYVVGSGQLTGDRSIHKLQPRASVIATAGICEAGYREKRARHWRARGEARPGMGKR